MPELDLSAEAVQFIIDKAHEFQSRDDVTMPEDLEDEEFDEDTVLQFAADYSGDAYYQELMNTISDLDPDQQMALVALMWVGRGEYSLDEWEEALQYAEETWTEQMAEYLISTPLLADYLAEGLQLFDTQDE